MGWSRTTLRDPRIHLVYYQSSFLVCPPAPQREHRYGRYHAAVCGTEEFYGNINALCERNSRLYLKLEI